MAFTGDTGMVACSRTDAIAAYLSIDRIPHVSISSMAAWYCIGSTCVELVASCGTLVQPIRHHAVRIQQLKPCSANTNANANANANVNEPRSDIEVVKGRVL
jgi:hypothetical protein